MAQYFAHGVRAGADVGEESGSRVRRGARARRERAAAPLRLREDRRRGARGARGPGVRGQYPRGAGRPVRGPAVQPRASAQEATAGGEPGRDPHARDDVRRGQRRPGRDLGRDRRWRVLAGLVDGLVGRCARLALARVPGGRIRARRPAPRARDAGATQLAAPVALTTLMAAMWPDEVDRVLAGDLTAALAYVTPAGGAVATAVAPIGLRDAERGTTGFTTSLGLHKKLERIRREPRVALAFHARDHGFADGPRYVLVQGDADFAIEPDERYLEEELGPRAERYLGPRRSGFFWDRWLREYYRDRVPVEIRVRRVVSWPDLDCRGESEVFGEPLPAGEVEPQGPPKKGAGP